MRVQHSVPLSRYDWRIVQPQFEAALKRWVGSGKTYSARQVAEALGCDERTVEGWLYDGRPPTYMLGLKLEIFLGADFENEVKTGMPATSCAVTLTEIDALRDAVAVASTRLASITERLSSGAQVIPMNKERA